MRWGGGGDVFNFMKHLSKIGIRILIKTSNTIVLPVLISTNNFLRKKNIFFSNFI
jgi:hypothetical protein